jgi:hypothetical protein
MSIEGPFYAFLYVSDFERSTHSFTSGRTGWLRWDPGAPESRLSSDTLGAIASHQFRAVGEPRARDTCEHGRWMQEKDPAEGEIVSCHPAP